MRTTALCIAMYSLAAALLPAAPNPPDITAWDERVKQAQRDAGAKVIEDIAAAKNRGDTPIRIPQGHYRFSKTTKMGAHTIFIVLSGFTNTTIDGGGFTFWFEDHHRAFYIGRSSGLTIKG